MFQTTNGSTASDVVEGLYINALKKPPCSKEEKSDLMEVKLLNFK